MKHILTAHRESEAKAKDTKCIPTNTKLDLVIRGIEPESLWTITGISGSGKSSLVNWIETEASREISVLTFSMEMSAKAQWSRKMKYLDSINVNIKESEVSRLDSADIWYIEDMCTIKQIKEIAESFISERIGKKILIIIDHLLLLNEKEERIGIAELEKVLVKLKKNKGVSIIQVAQMNRNIENIERIKNPQFHFPQRSDISTADTIFHASDLVLVVHRPEIIGIIAYGMNMLPTKDTIYIHIIKNREGDQHIITLKNKLNTQDWSYSLINN